MREGTDVAAADRKKRVLSIVVVGATFREAVVKCAVEAALDARSWRKPEVSRSKTSGGFPRSVRGVWSVSAPAESLAMLDAAADLSFRSVDVIV